MGKPYLPSHRHTQIFLGLFLLAPVFYFGYPYVSGSLYEIPNQSATSSNPALSALPAKKVFIATHIKPPQAVKGIYMTSCVAGSQTWRDSLLKIANETEINSIVIDIKDYTGTISFPIDNPMFEKNGGKGCRVPDMREFVQKLHEHDVYVIGRITVFQDPHYTKIRPDLAVQSISLGGPWKDYKGLSFIDVGAKEYWDYIVVLSRESYKAGFDEINFDYVRFPSDGDMKDVKYLWTGTTTKSSMLKDFFSYLNYNLSGTGPILSVDLFGMTTTNSDDLNIGQVLENTLPYFDYVSPMVYPSHYSANFNGWENPNKNVYDVVNYSMMKAVARVAAASTTPLKLRPWLQDFDYGGNYGEAEVRAQKKAVYDAGLTSWMLWDPANRYTREALDKE
ncbi:MAG: putative glycoside hydrolase [Patescibacteria group bacterium]